MRRLTIEKLRERLHRPEMQCPQCEATRQVIDRWDEIGDWLKPDPEPLACYDCLLPYGVSGWCDAHIPTDVWLRISPIGTEGGVLCITCMARRIEALGITDVPLQIGSGPWDFNTATERIRLEALEQGRQQGREARK